MVREAFAPAKINLFLHVGPVQGDGYHPISSLVVFADVGDRLTLAPAAAFELAIEGEFAGHLGAGPDNLVVRAREAALAAAAAAPSPFRLTLTKTLPLASGLGGGSSDGAAALRLIDSAAGLGLGEATLRRLALDLGADGPACLRGETAIIEGRGEILRPAPAMPILEAVLINPGVPSPTAQAYAAFDRLERRTPLGVLRLPERFIAAEDAAGFLRTCRNDLEAPVAARIGAIGEVLEDLRRQGETLIARMSGSGATCFALCADRRAALRLAERLAASRPHWWVRACRLGAVRA